jgi:hypothetical protein
VCTLQTIYMNMLCPADEQIQYTQGPDRWSGIAGGYGKNNVPACPPWGDCSRHAAALLRPL